ncbi:MAG: hypothetical protein ACJAUP_000904 [Cellvibrionaceae bacterium]|jgi:hypothetical protein
MTFFSFKYSSFTFSLLLFFNFLVINSARAETDWWTSSFYLDNDLFSDTDDGYTNGIRFSAVSPDLDDFDEDPILPSWLRSINRKLGFFRGDEIDLQRNMVVTLGQQMYTLDERYIDRTDVVEEDRPYAGWLYVGFGYQVSNFNRLDTAVFNIGVVGPSSRADDVQNTVHDARGFDKYQGWDNQLRDELGLQWLYTRKHKFYQPIDVGKLGYDIITQWGGSLGNVATYLEAGAEFRFGWNLPKDFGTSSASPGGDNSSPGSRFDSRVRNILFGGLHGFMAVNGRWVLHDITLDGNTFSDSHSVDKEPLVGSAIVGLAMTISRWKLSFSRQFITDQFKGQEDSKGYGTVSISYTHTF